jgi:hypothetical protein
MLRVYCKACKWLACSKPINANSILIGIGRMNTQATLDIAGLEHVYDALATAIDQAGPEKSELFLVKLALLNAKALANPSLFEAQIASALQDL